MAFQLTRTQFDRTATLLQRIAGEDVRVEFYASAFWAFGSELAVLRLAHEYRHTTTASVGRSEEFGHYFKLETPSFVGERTTKPTIA